MGENPLGDEKISKLLRGFAVPSITATLVGSLCKIADQIFIGQGVGYPGNASTNVSYPLPIIVGISQRVQPIIDFGAGKYARVWQAYLLAIKWNFAVSTVAFACFSFSLGTSSPAVEMESLFTLNLPSLL